MRLFDKRLVLAAWALSAAAILGSAAAPASAQTVAAPSNCPALAPIDAWARRNGYLGVGDGSSIVCGDFTGDGAPDAVATLGSDVEWTGNGMAPFGVILFRNVGGRLQHLRTVSAADDMYIYGSAYEPARFERGRVVLIRHTMAEGDARCCPTGVTAFTIDTATGRVSERLLRRMDEAEQQRLVDRADAEAGASPVAPAGWQVERNDRGGRYAIARTGMSTLPELRLACGTGGSPILAANVPNLAPNAHLNLTFTTAGGGIAVLDTGWQREPNGPNWVNILRDPAVPNLLGGAASAAEISLNGRSLGHLSLAGSTRTLSEGLAGCWQSAASRQDGGTVADAGFTVDIVLTPRAAAELSRRREGITVWTSFSGDPRNPNANHVDDHTGELDLGSHEVTVAGRSGSVVIPGNALRRERMSNLRGQPQVLVNVYSARQSAQDNLLTCGIVSGDLSEVAGRTHRITCALITEG